MKWRSQVVVNLEVEADDAIQAEEDMGVALIHMIRNDEIAFNIRGPFGAKSDAAKEPE